MKTRYHAKYKITVTVLIAKKQATKRMPMCIILETKNTLKIKNSFLEITIKAFCEHNWSLNISLTYIRFEQNLKIEKSLR
jgi:hypothetical protein